MTSTSSVDIIVSPPDDQEKYNYLRGPQHRWFFVAHAGAFAGLAVSLAGFATMTYWTLIFLVPLALLAVETLVGLRTSTFRRRTTEAEHRRRCMSWRPDRVPSVDVFLPTAGEPLEILNNTYRYVARLEYPGRVDVYVLDDMDRSEVRAAASAHGFKYIARPGSEFKKAGNLRYAFDRSDGDLIFILDADFVPRPDALTELAPYMDDPQIGIVQSPQYFATPLSKNWLERGAGATQEIFYRFIQVSRDAVDAAVCCGTSALYRRAALECIGGFPRIAHSEDIFTGIHMDGADYRVRFVPVNVTQGICPDDIDGFIAQQYRWCEGSMELVKDSGFHRQETLTLHQRLSFWSGFIYYVTTAMNALLAPLPVLIMALFFPQHMHPWNMLPLLGTAVLWLVVYPRLMNSSWRLDVLRVQAIYSFAHIVAIIDVFSGTVSEWVPSHGRTKAAPLAGRVRRLIVAYLGTTQVLVIAAFVWRLGQPEFTLAGWWAAGLFLLANVYVFVPVVLVALGVKPWPASLLLVPDGQSRSDSHVGLESRLVKENAA
ncbi:glycosyltransferase family 2 protein [Kocuria turfanensis]|nr:cellulose synthase catalytic subunit [Kocuria turfanensis]